MIANIVKPGHKTRGVLNYLYGPGRANEHTDPHLVASFDDFAPDPGRDPGATLAQLTAVLDLRVLQAGERAPKEHVWHCSIRAAPEDRALSDEEWATIARRVLNATGVAPAGDPDGCRWIAVRHAHDHIHIVATKVRGDLRPPRNWNDYLRADNELVAIEKEYGLRQVPRGDRTASKRSTRAEQEKAHRTGRPQTARERLRITARTALAAATTPQEFFTILSGSGVLVEIQHFPSGDIRAYKIALDGDTNKDGQPVWFAGSTLAPDLSYPKISERLAPADTPSAMPPQPDAWRRLAQTTDRVPDLLASSDDGTGQAHIAALAETLDALPLRAPADLRPQLMRAATAFEHAGRSRIRAQHHQARATRNAVKAILREPAPKDGAALAILLDALVLAVIAARHWHQAHHHDQQAEAARQAAEHLRAAYQAATVQPIAVVHQRGRHVALFLREQQAAVTRQALPDLAEQILAEPGWPALSATLAATKKAGHDPVTLLTQAARHRELDTATSYSEVLTWRLSRLADLPQHTWHAAPEPPPSARTIRSAQQRRTR
ncbi:relaxase/mobilization nuclease domain-containing protein [Streptomyces flavovirens]|uniref:relaxase/mobilization nuclease domain-containing protein n=1 Tax=Streptomyces flavovirens TaxID=52258 RepID=UPI003D0F2238